MPRRSRLSKEEKERLLSEPFQIWPDPKPGQNYGPTPKQKELFLPEMPESIRPHFHPKDVVLFAGGAQASKCLEKNTPVLMYDGTIKMVQNVQVEDLLMGPDSQPRRVLSLARGQEEMFKVIPTKGESWGCNRSHILSLKTSGKRVGSRKIKGKRTEFLLTGTVENISIDDYLKLSNRTQKCYKLYKSEAINFHKNKELLIDPYWLGCWLGDGSKNSTGITNIDPEIINYIYEYAEKLKLKVRVDKQKGITYNITCGNTGNAGKDNRLFMWLRSYNLISNKHIPYDYLTASIEERFQLLAGLVDTDGYSHKKCITITQKSKQLTKDIVFLARSLGLAVYIKERISSCMYKGEKKEGVYNEISILGKTNKVPVKLERKKNKSRDLNKQSCMVTGFTLESQGMGDYYGFELSGDQLFLLGDFTVTHNTVGGMGLAITRCLETPNVLVVYGAKTYSDLEDIVITEMKKRFTIHDPWDHPLIRKVPNEHSKTLEFINGSRIKFMHFDEVLRLRGRSADLIIIEEATQLPDAKAFEEACRRMSSIRLPILQIVLLTNNPEGRNWLYEKFALKQFTPAYRNKGLPAIPIGPECSCHLCQYCLFPKQDDIEKGKKSKEVELVNHFCPDCGIEQDWYEIKGKKTYCRGREQYWRVIRTSSQDNPHLASTYVQDNMGAMDSETAALYIMGEFLELRKGFVYWAFTDENVLADTAHIDWSKNIIWSFDFNTSFQCSVVCQEEGEKGKEKVFVIDEVIIPETRPNGPQYIVAEFIAKLKKLAPDLETFEKFRTSKKIEIYGDPSGYNRNLGSSEATYYQVIFNELKKAGFNLQIKVVRKTGKGVLPVTTKVNNLNVMLRNKEGDKRVFVNNKCIYLIAGLDGVRFKPDGKIIDNLPDKKAAESTDKSIVFTLTHPTDALAYYISARFPLVDDRELYNPFIIAPNEESIELTNEGIKEKTFKLKEETQEESLMDFISFFKHEEDELSGFYW